MPGGCGNGFAMYTSFIDKHENSRSTNRSVKQQAKVVERHAENLHRQRVLRDRAEIERREMTMRSGRNPGQGEY